MGTGQVTEVDDEVALIVLVEKRGYNGPNYTTGDKFTKNVLTLIPEKAVLIRTGDSKVKNAPFKGRQHGQTARAPDESQHDQRCILARHQCSEGEGGVIWHDRQQITKNGPFPSDTVIYWTK